MRSVSWLDVDGLILEVAAKFKQHDMREHLALLRGFYKWRRAETRARLRAKPPAPWNVDIVLGWVALWRIPPFDSIYKTLPKGAPCPCGAGQQAMHCECAWPGGHLLRCRACATTWLVPSDGQ